MNRNSSVRRVDRITCDSVKHSRTHRYNRSSMTREQSGGAGNLDIQRVGKAGEYSSGSGEELIDG